MVIKSDCDKKRLVQMAAILDFALKKHVPDRGFLGILCSYTREGIGMHSWKKSAFYIFFQVTGVYYLMLLGYNPNLDRSEEATASRH